MGSVISINSHVSEIDPLLLRLVPKYNLKRPLKAQANYVHASDRMFYMVTHKYLYFSSTFLTDSTFSNCYVISGIPIPVYRQFLLVLDALSIFLEIQKRIKWFKKGTIFFHLISLHYNLSLF